VGSGDFVVIANAGFTVIWNVAVAVTLLASVTITDTLIVPVVVGVPVMAPLAASVSPPGRELPDTKAQV
jgi:hypothetical protein